MDRGEEQCCPAVWRRRDSHQQFLHISAIPSLRSNQRPNAFNDFSDFGRVKSPQISMESYDFARSAAAIAMIWQRVSRLELAACTIEIPHEIIRTRKQRRRRRRRRNIQYIIHIYIWPYINMYIYTNNKYISSEYIYIYCIKLQQSSAEVLPSAPRAPAARCSLGRAAAGAWPCSCSTSSAVSEGRHGAGPLGSVRRARRGNGMMVKMRVNWVIPPGTSYCFLAPVRRR